ncbi:coiled-coil domain-containing protein 142 [Ornithorhynchus anatinus]|uniref:coiled-coil domain-containing protein 142 n=1 Tax=Ornithorhynchus anatinus TaxID=9258 RepID=UPI0019D47D21|nr:coiled-coil domain-containing protein 142 [Ornithorhynchus anatinus]
MSGGPRAERAERAEAGPLLRAGARLRALEAERALLLRARARPRTPAAPARGWRLVATERGRRAAGRLWLALRGSGSGPGSGPGPGDTLRALCAQERAAPGRWPEGLPGAARPASGPYRTLLWSACTRRLRRLLGPWRDPEEAAGQLSGAVQRAPLPPEGQAALEGLVRRLRRGSQSRAWDRGGAGPGPDRLPPSARPPAGFCRVLGVLPRGPRRPAAGLLLQLCAPLRSALADRAAPGRPRTLARLRSTLQTAARWLLGQTQRHVSGWAPGPLLRLAHRDLPLLLAEAEAVAALLRGTPGPDPEGRLTRDIRTLVGRLQVLPEEWPGLFSRECGRRAAEALRAHVPRGPSWSLRLGPPRGAGESVDRAAREVLGPVLRGLRHLPAPAQSAPFKLALTAFLGAWLDHVRSPLSVRLRRDIGALRGLLERSGDLPPELGRALPALGLLRGLEGAPGLGPAPPSPSPPPPAAAPDDPQGEPPCCCAWIGARPPGASHRGLRTPSSPRTPRGEARGRTGPGAYAPGDRRPDRHPDPAPPPRPAALQNRLALRSDDAGDDDGRGIGAVHPAAPSMARLPRVGDEERGRLVGEGPREEAGSDEAGHGPGRSAPDGRTESLDTFPARRESRRQVGTGRRLEVSVPKLEIR